MLQLAQKYLLTVLSLIGPLTGIAWAQNDDRVVNKMIERLHSSDIEVRRQAASGFAYSRVPNAEAAVPALIEALADQDERVRYGAATSLGAIGLKADQAIPALSHAVSDASIVVATHAVEALGHLGKESVPRLVLALADERQHVRRCAAEALARIGSDAQDAAVALGAAANDSDRSVQLKAIETLGKIGPRGVEALSKLLSNDNESVRWHSAFILSQAGAEAKFEKEVVDAIVAFDGEGSFHRCRTVQNIGDSGVKRLIADFASLDEKGRLRVVACVDQMGPQASEAEPLLVHVLQDSQQPDFLRLYCAKALGQISRQPDDTARLLIALLDDQKSRIRDGCMRGLEALGPAALPAIPKLVAIMQSDPDISNRNGAASAIGAVGPAAKEAVPALRSALKDKDRWVREKASSALGKIGPSAKDAAPDLLELMNGGERELQGMAAYALGRILADPGATIPDVPDSLRSSFDQGRREGRDELREPKTPLATGTNSPRVAGDGPSSSKALVGEVLGRGRLPGAQVALSQPPTSPTEKEPSMRVTQTDDLGTFRFEDVPDGKATLTAVTAGYEPSGMGITVGPERRPIQLSLNQAAPRDFTVVDASGSPIVDATVTINTYRSMPLAPVTLSTNGQGEFAFSIGTGFVGGVITKDGYMRHKFGLPGPGGQSGTIKLKKPFRIQGSVTDSETGNRIPQFTVKSGMLMGQVPMFFDEQGGVTLGSFADGAFEIAVNESVMELKGFDQQILGIESAGYKRAVSRSYTQDEGDIRFEFKLEKQSTTAGVVRLPTGEPAVGVEVVISKADDMWALGLNNGVLEHTDDKLVTRSDQRGQFSFPPQIAPYLLTIANEAGFASVPEAEFKKAPTITLQPWGKLEGTIRTGSRAAPHKTIVLRRFERFAFEPIQPGSRFTLKETPEDPIRVEYRYQATSDDRGHFAFEHVIPGKVTLSEQIQLEHNVFSESHLGITDVPSGKTTVLDLGGGGRSVIGRVALSKSANEFPCLAKMGGRLKSPPARSGTDLRSYPFRLEVDGSFRIEDVQPGPYLLAIDLACNEYGWPLTGVAEKQVTVPEVGATQLDVPFDLGILPVRPVNTLKPGASMPKLAIRSLDGELTHIADFRGRVLLVHFSTIEWDSFSREAAELQRVFEKHRENKQFAMITIHLDTDAERIKQVIKERNLGWPQFVPDNVDEAKLFELFGLHRTINIFLADPEQKLLQCALRFDEIPPAVEAAMRR